MGNVIRVRSIRRCQISQNAKIAKKNICRDCGTHCVECGYDFCRDDMKNRLMECYICGDIEICGMYHECPINDYWTSYDEECNDCILDDYFVNKYCFNERRYKMDRKLKGYEKNKNVENYLQRKKNKKRNFHKKRRNSHNCI